MSGSNNLGGVRIADNQISGHHRTSNEADNRIDAALTDGVAIGVTSGNAYTVAAEELRDGFHFVIGNGATSATAAFVISLPASIERGLTFWRNTLAYQATIQKVTSQTEPVVILPPGGAALIEYDGSNARLVATMSPFEMVVAAGDETTACTASAGKVTFRMPRRVWLIAVRASLKTAQASGSIFTVDINESGTTIISTKLTIDNTEKTSVTAATPPVISDAAIADDAEMTIDIDQVGDGTAIGLKVALIGIRY